MAEYIERAKAKEELLSWARCIKHPEHLMTEDAMCVLDGIPAADVVEVVHGKWVDHMVRDWRCSVCGEKINKIRKVDGYCYEDKPNYCPDCGARMGDS